MALIMNGGGGKALPNLDVIIYGASPLIKINADMAKLYAKFKCTANASLYLDGTASINLTANTEYNVADYTFNSDIGVLISGTGASGTLTFSN